MSPKLPSPLFPWLILLTFASLFFFYSSVSLYRPFSSTSRSITVPTSSSCNLFRGNWVLDTNRKPLYDETCPFHRNAWNCLRNKRENMSLINSWKWVPESCDLPRIDPFRFMGLMRNKNIAFVGDSLNENLLASFLCILRNADEGAKKWKRKGAWRGAYFPKYNVTVAYHRAVLLSKYQCSLWKHMPADNVLCSLLIMKVAAKAIWKRTSRGSEGIYRVDVDVPADDWVNIADFYDVLVFNTGHWWNHDKFPKQKPLVFYRAGQPIVPQLEMLDGLKVILDNTVSYVQNKFPSKTLKFWRLQSPRHFYGGDWNQNGSCLLSKPLEKHELDSWFEPRNNGVNKEARQLNLLIEEALQGTDIQVLDLTHLSEFRADAHPAIWLGRQDAVTIWGQDCMHWCLPGVPDTWVDILSQLILNTFGRTSTS